MHAWPWHGHRGVVIVQIRCPCSGRVHVGACEDRLAGVDDGRRRLSCEVVTAGGNRDGDEEESQGRKHGE